MSSAIGLMESEGLTHNNPIVNFINQAVALNLIYYLDLTTLFIEIDNKEACEYIIKNFNINTNEVKDLMDNETTDPLLLWKLYLIDEHENESYESEKEN